MGPEKRRYERSKTEEKQPQRGNDHFPRDVSPGVQCSHLSKQVGHCLAMPGRFERLTLLCPCIGSPSPTINHRRPDPEHRHAGMSAGGSLARSEVGVVESEGTDVVECLGGLGDSRIDWLQTERFDAIGPLDLVRSFRMGCRPSR